MKHLDILVLLCLRGGHAHKAQIANHSGDGPGALGAPVAGLPGKQVFSKRKFSHSLAG